MLVVNYMSRLSQQRAYRAEPEVVMRCDDVIESRVSQMNVLYRRINDVTSLRVDAVSEVSHCFQIRDSYTSQVIRVIRCRSSKPNYDYIMRNS